MGSKLVEHAKREFELKGWLDSDDKMQNLVCDNIIELLTVFSKQNHSGFSAAYVISNFMRLVRWEPLGSLTGEDSEWNKIEDDLWQNKRCLHVFKNPKTGEAWDTDAVVFEDPNGSRWTNSGSVKEITFPYDPKTEVLKR